MLQLRPEHHSLPICQTIPEQWDRGDAHELDICTDGVHVLPRCLGLSTNPFFSRLLRPAKASPSIIVEITRGFQGNELVDKETHLLGHGHRHRLGVVLRR